MFRRVFVPALALLACLAPAARAQVKLEYKFPEGTASRVRMNVKTHQVLSIMGTDLETEADSAVVARSTIGRRDPGDGTLPVTQKIESIRTQLSLPGGLNVDFDTENPGAKVDNPQLAVLGDVYKALVSLDHTLVLDRQNKVKEVKGTDKLAEKLEGLEAGAAAQVKSRFSPDKIKQAFEQEHGNLPEVLAREGEPWEATEVTDLGSGQTLTFRKRYEYQGEVRKDGKALDKIGVKALTASYAMDPDAPSPVKATKSDLKVDSTEGTILFDREAGRVVEDKQVVRVKGDLTLEAAGKELPSTLDLTLDVTKRREDVAR